MTLGLTGGVALADNGRGRETRRETPTPTVRDHRGSQRVDREPVRVERGERFDRDRGERFDRDRGERFDRDRGYARQEIRFDRDDDRRGSEWIAGQWQWNGYEWSWMPGHYVRISRW